MTHDPTIKLQEDKQKLFIEELRRLTGVSAIYANAAFYTLDKEERANPNRAAKGYQRRFSL
jgi:hypothetical protein